MENVMTNGFCELNEQEMMMVDGGFDESDWERIDSFLEGMTGYDSKELCNKAGDAVKKAANSWYDYWFNVGYNAYNAH